MVRRVSTRWVLCALAVGGMLACGSAPLRGAPKTIPENSNLKGLSLEDLGNIEVTTASKEPEEVWQTPDAIYVLTNEDIRRSGVTSVPDALRLVPGVNVERVSGDRNWVVAIRGLGDQFSKYIQVLIDGRSVYTPLFGGVFWTLDNVMLEDVDRIEVIRGPGGTIWGDNAVNGIINIITKSSGDTQGTLLAVGGGNVDQGTGSLRYGGRSHGLTYRVYGMGFARSAEYHTDGQNYDWSHMGQAGVHSDWKQGRDEVTAQGDIYLGKLGDAQVIPSFNPVANSISYASTNTAGGNILGRWRRDLGNHSDFYLQAYWSIDRRLGPNFGELRNNFDIDFLHRTPPTKYQQFTYGLGIRISPSSVQQTNQTLGFAPPDKTDSVYSGFMQEEIHIVPGKLSLTAGTKLEHNSYTGFEYQPNGRLLWTPSPTATIWLAASRAVRIPDRVDDDIDDFVLPVTSPLIYAVLVGNTNLRAERLVSYELGFRTLIHGKFYMDFAGFHNQYHDLIAQGPITLPTMPPPAQLPGGAFLVQLQYENGIHGNTDGGEVGPDWQPTTWWQLKAAYSYLHVRLANQHGFSDPMNVTLTTLHGSSPNSQAVLRSLTNLPHMFELDETIRFVGALPAQQVKAYVTADLRAGYHNPHGLDISVVGENLFQPHHAEFGIVPGPNVQIKRSIYAKLVWTR